MLRLFVALDLPEQVRARLALLQGGVPGARWVRRENLHLTLRFLGEVDHGTARDVDAALARVQAAGFDVLIDGVGHFGPSRSPQVLWAGIARSEALQFLHGKVDRAAVAAGLAADDRKFHPHVTLAHLRGANAARVARWLADNAIVQAGPVPVAGFVLYRSHLHNEGSIYEPLAEYPLAAT